MKPSQNHEAVQKTGFTGRRPILAIVLIEVALFLALFSAGAYLTMNELTDQSPVPYAFVPFAIVLAAYLLLHKRWQRYGFRSMAGVPRRELLFYLPLVIDILVVLTNGIVNGFEFVSTSHVLYLLFLALLVAFVEETIYRGLILNILLQKGARTAVIVSSLLFSLTHLLNLMGGQDLAATLLQLLYALLVGLSLSLLFVKHGSLLPLMAFHFLHDFTQFLVADAESVLFDSLVVAALLFSCIWLILDVRKNGSTRAGFSSDKSGGSAPGTKPTLSE
ncbi:CPBP family intramembrane glutamic endopeptidase [Gorillibacterium timonense]|uniref:CPBP family intramembrane glutamic endopeptidase n=1 Tax=Gorillibacterium timonense TaxID=1689269 RepID=UPI00071C60E5|nr:type II CAAX endopeptidase family protein [Gorillibacterium timonense]